MNDGNEKYTRRSLLGSALGMVITTSHSAFAEHHNKQEARSNDRKRPHSASSGTSNTSGQSPTERRLHLAPPRMTNRITVDLNEFNPELPYPGWDGQRPRQGVEGRFPRDRDLLVLGHRSRKWTGKGSIRGGRNVHWLGGAYAPGPYLRNFVGDAMLEGIVTDFPFVAGGQNTGDGVTIAPDPITRGSSTVHIANCRINNIDGFKDGVHGDCYQLPADYGPKGWGSCPKVVHIERFTASTGCQGLFLAAQSIGRLAQEYPLAPELLTLRDVNIRQTRSILLSLNGNSSGNVNLLYMCDTTPKNLGNRIYAKRFHNVYLEPLKGVHPLDCVFPDASNTSRLFSLDNMLPELAPDKKSLHFQSDMMTSGRVHFGPPPAGDFARTHDGLQGGLDAPGFLYASPGYLLA